MNVADLSFYLGIFSSSVMLDKLGHLVVDLSPIYTLG